MPPAIRRDGLHLLFWQWSRGPHHTLHMNQREMAARLGIRHETLNRLLREFEDDGRVLSLSPSLGATEKTYRIVPPREWQAQRVPGAGTTAER